MIEERLAFKVYQCVLFSAIMCFLLTVVALILFKENLSMFVVCTGIILWELVPIVFNCTRDLILHNKQAVK